MVSCSKGKSISCFSTNLSLIEKIGGSSHLNALTSTCTRAIKSSYLSCDISSGVYFLRPEISEYFLLSQSGKDFCIDLIASSNFLSLMCSPNSFTEVSSFGVLNQEYKKAICVSMASKNTGFFKPEVKGRDFVI